MNTQRCRLLLSSVNVTLVQGEEHNLILFGSVQILCNFGLFKLNTYCILLLNKTSIPSVIYKTVTAQVIEQ